MKRIFFAWVAVLVAALFLLSPESAQAADSGKLGDWSKMSRVRSTEAYFARADVWVYGDSITHGTYRGLVSEMYQSRGLHTAVDAWSGRPTTPAVDAYVRDVAAHGAPRVVVMAVGTNDIFDPSVMRAQINRVKAATPSTTRLIWVDVYAARPRWAAADLQNSAKVNWAISTSRVSQVHWYGFLTGKPGRPAYYLRDGVHTNTAGAAARNLLISRAVKSAL